MQGNLRHDATSGARAKLRLGWVQSAVRALGPRWSRDSVAPAQVAFREFGDLGGRPLPGGAGQRVSCVLASFTRRRMFCRSEAQQLVQNVFARQVAIGDVALVGHEPHASCQAMVPLEPLRRAAAGHNWIDYQLLGTGRCGPSLCAPLPLPRGPPRMPGQRLGSCPHASSGRRSA